MHSSDDKALIRLSLTQEQKEQVKHSIGRDGDALELSVQELEERIAPRLAANHNEILLAER
jgi:uncharacterized small protein (DUF1192 family)